ncbi:hypothetical protein OEZ85_011732 [Tetradesmus obliquus]|uniref:Uncharacterized protein n=1 Tax=Tetradesmus obliquus TaxID=3088 RepID=A0ABY8TRZ5_TETOB|nr:hypothetical protein OEZ85_011732 [Tetradesmus obliquus]
MRLANTIFLSSGMLMKAAGSRLCGGAGTAQHHLNRPAAVAGLFRRPFGTALNHQASAGPVSSSSAALRHAHLDRQQRGRLFTTRAAYSEAPAADLASEGLAAAGDGQQPEYDPTLYDAQYVNYVSLTGTVMNINYNGNQCGFTMLLNKHTDPSAGAPPVFDSVRVYVAAEAASQLQEGQMFNVIARLAQDDQGNLMISGDELNLIRNPPPEELVASANYQPPSQQQQQQQYGQPPPQQYNGQQQYGTNYQPPSQQQQSAAVAAGLPPLIRDVPGMPEYSDDPMESRWIDLFNNPNNYFDNRVTKRDRQPDFNSRAKDAENRRSGLWIDSKYTPQWVLDYLAPGGRSRNSSYSNNKSSYSNSYGNQGGGGGDAYMPEEASSTKEAEWMELCNNYGNWWDNRANKMNPRAPDFKQKGRTGQEIALWISSRDTPQWVPAYIAARLPQPPPPRNQNY